MAKPGNEAADFWYTVESLCAWPSSSALCCTPSCFCALARLGDFQIERLAVV